MQSTLIAKQTAADTQTFDVVNRNPVTVLVSGISGSETIALNVRTGSSWEPVTDIDGTTLVFSTSVKQITVTASGTYQVVKGVTASATGVYLEK